MVVTAFFHTLMFRITDFVCEMPGSLKAGPKEARATSHLPSHVLCTENQFRESVLVGVVTHCVPNGS